MCIELRTVRVFVNASGEYGNKLGIVLRSSALDDNSCLAIAISLGLSETVFIDDPTTGKIRIFTPMRQLAFAGYPAVGAAWLLERLGFHPRTLLTAAGTVSVFADGDGAAIEAPSTWSSPWKLQELPNSDEVREASSIGENRHDYVWAWTDMKSGVVHARAFTSASGSVEDEATGSAAMCLSAALGLRLVVHQGAGSVLQVNPLPNGKISLSGLVAMDAPSLRMIRTAAAYWE